MAGTWCRPNAYTDRKDIRECQESSLEKMTEWHKIVQNPQRGRTQTILEQHMYRHTLVEDMLASTWQPQLLRWKTSAFIKLFWSGSIHRSDPSSLSGPPGSAWPLAPSDKPMREEKHEYIASVTVNLGTHGGTQGGMTSTATSQYRIVAALVKYLKRQYNHQTLNEK